MVAIRLCSTIGVLLSVCGMAHVDAVPANDPTTRADVASVGSFHDPFSSTSGVFLEGSTPTRFSSSQAATYLEHRGGGLLPAGYNPFGYLITPLGERFLEFGTTCLESDVGRFLASLKSKRKTRSALQAQWLEIVRVSKTGQSMRIYRTLQDLVDFCLAARLID